MVTTRQGKSATVQRSTQPTLEIEGSEKNRGRRNRGREKAPDAIATSQQRASRKRSRPGAEEQAIQPRRERPRLRYVLDEHADEVPDEDFFRNIERTVMREKKGVENEDMDAEKQLLQESQDRLSNNDEEAEAEDSDGAKSDDEQMEEVADYINEEEGNKESQEEEREEEEDIEEEEQEDELEGTRKRHQGPLVRRVSLQTEVQNITSISISTGMDFVHPDAEGTTLYTSSVSCDLFNALIPHMGKRGWTGLKRDWAHELLPLDEETEAQWTVRHGNILKSRRMDLFKKTLNLWEICRLMPRAQNLHAQTLFLRENTSHVKTTLTDIQTMVQEMEQQMLHPTPNATKKQKANKRINLQILLECICKRLIPLLVLALKESLLLGGPVTTSPEHDTISIQGNTFMVCTLQFAIRITGFIDGLYSVVKAHTDTHKPLERDSGDKSIMRQRERAVYHNRKTFGHHLSALRTHLLASMLEIQQLANEPIRNKEAAERDQYIREQREQIAAEIQEAQTRQMNLFWESITPGPYNQKRMYDEYYRKHGWQLWEDETLLGTIRRQRKPNMEDLAQRLPRRTLSEVTQRVSEIRTWQKAKYRAMNKVPPKWCYH